MSSLSVATVLTTRGLKPAERIVLWAFAEVSDDAGYSWRSKATVAVLTELDERHVGRIIADLRRRGYLDQTYMGGGRGIPALYRVLPTLLTDDPDAKSRAKYEDRFRLAAETRKGGNMSPFNLSTRGAPTRVKGGVGARKGGSTDPPSSNELDMNGGDEPEEDLDPAPALDFEREEDESINAYLKRTARLRRDALDKVAVAKGADDD